MKVELKTQSTICELSSTLEKLFSCFTIVQYGSHGVAGRDRLSETRLMVFYYGSEWVLTYEDKDGDQILIDVVPYDNYNIYTLLF